MVASHISTQGGNTGCTAHKDWSKQSQRAQKTGVLQCGEPREHQDGWQKDVRAGSSQGPGLRSNRILPADQCQMLGWQNEKNETKGEGNQTHWAVLSEEPVVPIEDGNGSGDKTMPALAQATEGCWRTCLQIPQAVLLARDCLQPLPQGGLGCAVHTLVVLHLWATVTVVALLQAVIEQAQVLFHLLGLVHRVRVQDLWESPESSEETWIYLYPTAGRSKLPVSPEVHHGTAPTLGRQIQAGEEPSDIVTGPKEGAMSMTPKGVTHHTSWQSGHLGGPSLAVLHTQPGQSPKRSHAQADVSL